VRLAQSFSSPPVTPELVKTEDASYFKDRTKWREWLRKHHDRKSEVWLLIYKKSAGNVGVPYEEAVEEAICFGWIDGKLRRIDDKCHAIRFTPRRKGCIWSESNRKRAEKMVREHKMTKPGLERITEAKKGGQWAAAYAPRTVPRIPEGLKSALRTNTTASRNFGAFANSHKSAYVHWVLDAKKEETRARRIKEVVARAAANKRPGT
jgi:uncharacterized protein YdeI (YjbR/CyaY-like superfamily)